MGMALYIYGCNKYIDASIIKKTLNISIEADDNEMIDICLFQNFGLSRKSGFQT